MRKDYLYLSFAIDKKIDCHDNNLCINTVEDLWQTS